MAKLKKTIFRVTFEDGATRSASLQPLGEGFNISIKHIKSEKTFVPLGIPACNGEKENKTLDFEIEVQQNEIESYKIEILQDDNIIFTVNSGEEELPQTFDVGKHTFKWDGFDSNGIYDSTIFTIGKLKARIRRKRNGKEKIAESSEFEFDQKIKWVDTKIDKNGKRIDVTLRVNLKDGGAKGIKCYEKDIDPDPKFRVPIKVCPWDKISKEALSYYQNPIIKSCTKSFEELKEMVLEGINTYWSRRYTKTEGTIINNTNWEIIVTAVNTEDSSISLNDIPLIYNTNSAWSRSGNTGGSYNDGNLDDEVMGLLPNGIVQRISFNSGYIYHSNWKEWNKSHPIHKTKGWVFNIESKEKEDFKKTAAHEIGHELLQAYYGTTYSWQHKGSSYYFPQEVKPKNESLFDKITHFDFMASKGEDTPKGEIDLMKYYNDYSDYKNRIVASDEDVKGLLWLTKLSLK